MKIYNLPRCAGKTTRAMTLSEYYNAPILCATYREKERLIQTARDHFFRIPDPVTVADLREQEFPDGIIVDELFPVLVGLVSEITNRPVDIKAVTFSEI